MKAIDRLEKYRDELKEKHNEPGKNIFTVSGLSGTGSSTVAKLIADKYDLDRFSIGQFFRKEAQKRDMDIVDFMENIEHIEDEEDIDYDVLGDKKIIEKAYTQNDVILDGRMAGVLLVEEAKVRVLVTADPETVAERLELRENVSQSEAIKRAKNRNEADVGRYRKKYGIDVTNNKYYNVVVENNDDIETLKERLFDKIEKVL